MSCRLCNRVWPMNIGIQQLHMEKDFPPFTMRYRGNPRNVYPRTVGKELRSFDQLMDNLDIDAYYPRRNVSSKSRVRYHLDLYDPDHYDFETFLDKHKMTSVQ